MTVPAAPTAGEPITEAWGDVVHDAVVAQDVQSGIATGALSNAGASTLTVTFPRPFAAPPTVVATGQWTSVAGFAGPVVSFQGAPSTTAVTFRISNMLNSNVTVPSIPVHWIAYGPRA